MQLSPGALTTSTRHAVESMASIVTTGSLRVTSSLPRPSDTRVSCQAEHSRRFLTTRSPRKLEEKQSRCAASKLSNDAASARGTAESEDFTTISSAPGIASPPGPGGCNDRHGKGRRPASPRGQPCFAWHGSPGITLASAPLATASVEWLQRIVAEGASNMALVWLATVALAAVLGIVVSVNRMRYERRLAREMRALLAVPASAARRPGVAALPPPVARYRQLAVAERAPVHTLRLHHGGTFRLSATGKELPIRGVQLFTADPPGFVWTGRIQMFPGVWIDARDMTVAGQGSMRVLLDDTVPLADVRGPELDQGSALRLLAEMPWYPTSLFDTRTVTWSAIDGDHASATLRLGDRQVSGIFAFGADGLPLGMTAKRFNDKGKLVPWGGTYRDWRTVSGMRVPFEAQVSWQLETGPFTYAHWFVHSMHYDEAPVPGCT